jgi:hypothetical protein
MGPTKLEEKAYGVDGNDKPSGIAETPLPHSLLAVKRTTKWKSIDTLVATVCVKLA